MKKTTLILDDTCLKKVKTLAQKQGKTMTQLVNELLAEGVRRRETPDPNPPLELPSFPMGRTKIDLADRDALEDAMSD